MESIIAQAAVELVEVIIKTIEEKGLSNIGKIAEALFGTIQEESLTD